MSDAFELVTLRNGFRAVRHKGNGEVMHPSVGPWAEANTLYIEQARFDELLRTPSAEPIRILDVGLGAAANAVAALTRWRALRCLRALELHSFEVDLMPLRLAVEDPLGFPFLIPFEAELRRLLADGSVEQDGLRWKLSLGDALENFEQPGESATLIFHDPFSPESNPTLWTPDAFAKLRARSTTQGEGTRLFTYSASTRTRVSMLLGGFFVGFGDKIGTKQETTVASTRLDLLARPLPKEWLGRWERSSARAPFGVELTPVLERAVREHPQFR